MNSLIERFKNIRIDLLQTVKDFPKNKRNDKLFDNWNLKDLMAHMSGWMISATNNVECLKMGITPPWVEDIDIFNKNIVNERKNWDWDKVYEELLTSSEKFVSSYETLPKELWQKKYWKNKSFTPEKILKIEIEHWGVTHLPQIKTCLTP